MDQITQGKLARAFLKNSLLKDGLRLGSIKRDIPNLAKEMEVSPTDLMELYEIITREIVDEAFPKEEKAEQ